jgi:hypothetical protein
MYYIRSKKECELSKQNSGFMLRINRREAGDKVEDKGWNVLQEE